MTREFRLLDKLLCEIDIALRAVATPENRYSQRENPAKMLFEPALTMQEKRHVAGLMRVNHAGEVCAQALYQGQALTAKLEHVKQQMAEAAAEEIDHLAWCEQRLKELGSRPSVLNPIWYAGSLLLGALAGIAGDQWSLGFVAETERQVTAHLQKHLQTLPKQDIKTQSILTTMQNDETHHAETAMAAGAAKLPNVISRLMQGMSKLLTKSSYYM